MSQINLGGFEVQDTYFNGANLTSANFENAVVDHCDFTATILMFSNFDVSGMLPSIVEGADFDGASISKRYTEGQDEMNR